MFLKKIDFKSKSTTQDQELTILLCIVSLIGIGICVAYLSYGENLYSVGAFWTSPVLVTLICNELGKYFLYRILYQDDKSLNLRESAIVRKKKTLRHRLTDAIKICGVIGFFFSIYGLLCISFGAPVLEHYEETITLAFILTILTIFPLTIFLGANSCLHYLWTDTLEINNQIHKSYILLIKISAAGAIFGAWSGSIVVPLDWDRQWQVYPIPNIIGALLGYSLGTLTMMSQKLISRFVPSFIFLPCSSYS